MNESISILEAEPVGGAERLSVLIVGHGFDLACVVLGPSCRDERKHITTLAPNAVMRVKRSPFDLAAWAHEAGHYRGIRRQVTGDLMKSGGIGYNRTALTPGPN